MTAGSPQTAETAFACPRCGTDVTLAFYGPCDECRKLLRRIYHDRNRVRLAAIPHLPMDRFNAWLHEPCESMGGDTPWQWIDAGFTDQVIEIVKTLKRDWSATTAD